MAHNYLTTGELVSKLPGTSKGYWAQLRSTGNGPRYFKPSPKVVLYDEADVDAWIQASAHTKTKERV